MMCSKKRFKIILCLVFMAFVMILSGCNKKIVLSTGFKKDEVFRVDSKKCTKSEVLVYLVNMHNMYTDMYGSDIWKASRNGISIEEDLEEEVMARLTKIKLMNLLAVSYNVSLNDEDMDKVNAATNEYWDSLSEADIKAMGNVSKKKIKAIYKEYATAYKLYDSLVADVNPEISDDEARTIIVKEIFIDTTNRTLEDGTVVTLTDQERADKKSYAESILARLNAGEEFDALAVECSDRELENLYYVKGQMDSMIENSVFALAGEQYSNVLAGSDGYYIVYCVNPFSREGTEDAKKRIVDQRKKEIFDSVYDSFAESKEVYTNDKLYGKIHFKDNDKVTTSSFFEVYNKNFE